MSAKTYTNGENLHFSPAANRHGNGGVMGAIALRLLQWQERANLRSHLADLDKHYLTDAGLSPADVRAETEKAFWQS